MNHQNQGSIIHHFLQRRTCCLVSALLGISTNGNSAHHLHQPSIAMRDNISMQARYQLYLAKHILHFIIQRVPRHSSIPDNKLSDRHHLTPSTLHFYHVLFGLSTKCSMGNHLITPKEIKLTITARSWQLETDKKLQGWCTDLSTSLWSPPISKSISPLNRSSYWLVMSLLSTNEPQTGTLTPKVFSNHQGSLKWLKIWPGFVKALARKTLADLDT